MPFILCCHVYSGYFYNDCLGQCCIGVLKTVDSCPVFCDVNCFIFSVKDLMRRNQAFLPLDDGLLSFFLLKRYFLEYLPSSYSENQYVWAVCRSRAVVKYKPCCYTTLLNRAIISLFSHALGKFLSSEFEQTSDNFSNTIDHHAQDYSFKVKC